MKKVVLISMFALCAGAPAFAENFPANELMLENKTYDNAATYDNMGIYSGTVSAIAEYVDSAYTCDSGKYLPHGSEQCAPCPANNYCPGGEYAYSEDTDRGITACADGLYAPAGMWESAQCGHILHVGEYVVYLRATPRTEQSVGFRFDDGTFYANVSADDVPMHDGTTRLLKVGNDETSWSLYDDTVVIE